MSVSMLRDNPFCNTFDKVTFSFVQNNFGRSIYEFVQ